MGNWHYNPYKWSYNYNPTYNFYGAHLVYIQSHLLYKVFTVFDRYVFGVQIPNLRRWPWMSRVCLKTWWRFLFRSTKCLRYTVYTPENRHTPKKKGTIFKRTGSFSSPIIFLARAPIVLGKEKESHEITNTQKVEQLKPLWKVYSWKNVLKAHPKWRFVPNKTLLGIHRKQPNFTILWFFSADLALPHGSILHMIKNQSPQPKQKNPSKTIRTLYRVQLFHDLERYITSICSIASCGESKKTCSSAPLGVWKWCHLICKLGLRPVSYNSGYNSYR